MSQLASVSLRHAPLIESNARHQMTSGVLEDELSKGRRGHSVADPHLEFRGDPSYGVRVPLGLLQCKQKSRVGKFKQQHTRELLINTIPGGVGSIVFLSSRRVET